MNPKITLIGLDYHTAPLAVRERMGCTVAGLSLARWQADGRFPDLHELVILSTCNRVEVYSAFAPGTAVLHTRLLDLLSELTGVETAVFADHTYSYTGQAAASHLFRVAAGLESLVLGEPQILGQVTDAYMTAVSAKTIGPHLTELFRGAIRTGKRARSETNISHNPMSVSSLAIAQAQKTLGDLSARHCLIVGMGEMGQLALKRLRARKVQNITLINRSPQRAADLAQKHGLVARPWAELPAAIADADVVISATGAPHAVITVDMVETAVAQRSDRPLILLDIAVPRDVDPPAAHIPGVHLTDADQLQGDLDKALAARKQEIPKVERIIKEELDILTAQWRVLSVKPVIVNMRHKAEQIRQQEMDRILHRLGDVDPQTRQQLQFFSRSLVNKLLHEPTIRLKDNASHEEAGVYTAVISDLFGLGEMN
ncbi:MAG: glutamyl-tRNA reductase [Chloroflexi bacterium]|nr:glutamyl-tRNA reductase [Chloroflexota bacterium]